MKLNFYKESIIFLHTKVLFNQELQARIAATNFDLVTIDMSIFTDQEIIDIAKQVIDHYKKRWVECFGSSIEIGDEDCLFGSPFRKEFIRLSADYKDLMTELFERINRGLNI